ncbi:hypothetical protein Scep_029813 [Stephania cephalantha]|uniref:Uncharacterized protein n=1 Tax=Stephania cephalantha TaxID=152367 RepID=A0AAP0E2X3_9MAGN
MSKAVRWLVIELQQGSGAAGSASHAHPSVPFDARFHEDSRSLLHHNPQSKVSKVHNR